MHQRCKNPNNPNYYRYGGVGITVCERWDSFEAFCEDMAPRPIGMSLDRIDSLGDYTPENCRWATPLEQMQNRVDSIYCEHRGESKTLSEWCNELKLNYSFVYRHLKAGKNIEEIMTLKFNDTYRSKWGAIEINGVTRKLKEWCVEYRKPYPTVYARIRRGIDPLTALTQDNVHTGRTKYKKFDSKYAAIKIRGRTQSLSDWCREYGILYQTAYYALFIKGVAPWKVFPRV